MHGPVLDRCRGAVSGICNVSLKVAKRLTGESLVPVPALDDGEVISDSANVVVWARDPPAHRTS
jgi:hypothetical protein